LLIVGYLVGGRLDGPAAVGFLVVVFGLLIASQWLTGIWTGGGDGGD
jgi:hypothetical protein